MLDLLKDTQNSPSPWLNVVPSLSKIFQAVVARNDQANLQQALNNGTGGQVSLLNVYGVIYSLSKAVL